MSVEHRLARYYRRSMHTSSIVHRRARLANGLEIQAEVDSLAHTTAIGFFVKTGARDEPIQLMGVSHFLEHMMFKGSSRRDALQVNRDFDELGASHNAFTTSELTAYYAHVLPERMHATLEILADLLRPSLRVADFDEEKGVILEEIAMYSDQPSWVGYESMMEHLYLGHPLAHRVLGTTASVTDLTRDQMASYFESRYTPDNAVLVAAGNIDFDALVAQATELCGPWTPTQPTRAHPSWMPVAADVQLKLKNTARAYLMLAMAAPSVQDPRRYAMSVLMHILGGGDGSRLHWALVETGIAEEASSTYDGHDGLGDSTIFAVCDPERVDEIEAILRSELAALLDSLTEDDLLRARSRIATGAAAAGERPNGRMFRLGTLWCYGSEYLTLEAEVEQISAVTLADMRACCESFPLLPTVRVVVLPEDEAADDAADAREDEVESLG